MNPIEREMMNGYCGCTLEPGTLAYYAQYTEGPNGGWAPPRRYLHIVCPKVQP